MIPTAPKPIPRPKLARFIFDRGLDLKQAAEPLGCSYEQVRLICLPFGDERRRVPGSELMARIVVWTENAITPADFYPPELSAPVADPGTGPATGAEAGA
jgi:hypothetical protein